MDEFQKMAGDLTAKWRSFYEAKRMKLSMEGRLNTETDRFLRTFVIREVECLQFPRSNRNAELLDEFYLLRCESERGGETSSFFLTNSFAWGDCKWYVEETVDHWHVTAETLGSQIMDQAARHPIISRFEGQSEKLLATEHLIQELFVVFRLLGKINHDTEKILQRFGTIRAYRAYELKQRAIDQAVSAEDAHLKPEIDQEVARLNEAWRMFYPVYRVKEVTRKVIPARADAFLRTLHFCNLEREEDCTWHDEPSSNEVDTDRYLITCRIDAMDETKEIELQRTEHRFDSLASDDMWKLTQMRTVSPETEDSRLEVVQGNFITGIWGETVFDEEYFIQRALQEFDLLEKLETFYGKLEAYQD